MPDSLRAQLLGMLELDDLLDQWAIPQPERIGMQAPDPALPDRQVIQCNFTQPTSVAVEGARAFVVRLNPGNGNDRIQVLVYSRGHRWVEKWEDARRLGNFRVKTLPPEHPLYGRAEGWERPEFADDLLGQVP